MLRRRKYLDHVRGERCLISGLPAQPDDPVDPCHIGTAGKGIKSPDNEVIPLLHSHHAAAHRSGEISYLRKHLPNDVLRAALKAYARELYAEWDGK